MLRALLGIMICSPAIRMDMSLVFGLFMNTVYIASNFASALLYRSVWATTVTAYHSLLFAIRILLLNSRRRFELGEIGHSHSRQVSLHVGVIMLLIDVSALFVMLRILRGESHTDYSGVLLLGFLIYTVYSLISSVYGMFRWLNDNQYLHFAAVNLNLTTALMSLFNLQYSFLSSLGADSRVVLRVGEAGALLIFCVIILLSIHLIIKSRAPFYSQNS